MQSLLMHAIIPKSPIYMQLGGFTTDASCIDIDVYGISKNPDLIDYVYTYVRLMRCIKEYWLKLSTHSQIPLDLMSYLYGL